MTYGVKATRMESYRYLRGFFVYWLEVKLDTIFYHPHTSKFCKTLKQRWFSIPISQAIFSKLSEGKNRENNKPIEDLYFTYTPNHYKKNYETF